MNEHDEVNDTLDLLNSSTLSDNKLRAQIDMLYQKEIGVSDLEGLIVAHCIIFLRNMISWPLRLKDNYIQYLKDIEEEKVKEGYRQEFHAKANNVVGTHLAKKEAHRFGIRLRLITEHMLRRPDRDNLFEVLESNIEEIENGIEVLRETKTHQTELINKIKTNILIAEELLKKGK